MLVAAMATMFVGCKAEDDDDDANAIKGSANHYTVNYTNDTEDTYRAYDTTTYKHAGALWQITLLKDSKSGALGYIWDLESDSTRAAKAVRRFCIAGFNYNHTAKDKVAYYVSGYKNVVDISAANFGTAKDITATEGKHKGESFKAVEKEFISLNSTHSFEPTKDSDGNVIVTFDVYEDGDWTWNGSKRKYTSYNGGYVVDIYDGAVTSQEIAAETAADNKKDSVKIPADYLGYKTDSSDTTKSIVKQQPAAVYINAYKGTTLNGKWDCEDTYKEAIVVEE
ncbi:MAG: hypothetical protein UIB61_01120 [Treponema sp.]|nr:hypothetical protein [Treponema sp.]